MTKHYKGKVFQRGESRKATKHYKGKVFQRGERLFEWKSAVVLIVFGLSPIYSLLSPFSPK
ncbi:MAG: hypothetical protein CVV21_03025 [Candidatus Goldiibacteriota bacterium HGW-Goldbacteria-1]|nr:MAG: hypothetical protein CVV21_03025 [Candidatus Goldiibacteriota bacterium HGW-Goldbacteria-1]